MSADIEQAKYEQVWLSDDYRKFSPGLQAIKRHDLLAWFHQLGVRSILDVGCGSGKAMQEMQNSIYKFTVDGFDIAYNCLDESLKSACNLTTGCVWTPGDLPTGYDLLFSTDLLEHIPADKVLPTLQCMRDATKKYVYLGIALFPDCFGPKLLGTPLHLSVHSSVWWLNTLKEVGLKVCHSMVSKANVVGEQQETWLNCLCQKAGT